MVPEIGWPGGDPDLGSTYHRHWPAALEKIVIAKTLAGDAELRLRRMECAANPPGRHDHPARREPVRIDPMKTTQGNA